MIIKSLHIGISVMDVDGSIAWYKRNLGFTLVSREYAPTLETTVAFIRNGEIEIELFKYKEPKGLPNERGHPNKDLKTTGAKHIALYVVI